MVHSEAGCPWACQHPELDSVDVEPSELQRAVDALAAGDLVRVTFAHTSDPVIGVLRRAEPASVGRAYPRALFLGEYQIRDARGHLGFAVRGVQMWTQDARFDAAVEELLIWLDLDQAWHRASKSEQDAIALKRDEAKNEFIENWLAGAP